MTAPYAKRPGSQFINDDNGARLMLASFRSQCLQDMARIGVHNVDPETGEATFPPPPEPRQYTWLRRLSGKADHTSMMLRYAYYMAQQETSELKEQFKSALAMGNMLQRGWPTLRAHWLREEWRLKNE